jgi:phenylacetate-CoA ligase
MNLRSCVFWGLDILKGRKIKKSLTQVKQDMLSPQSNQDIKKLKSILQYSIDNIPYYHNIKSPTLENFPVMNKKKYLENYDDFFSPEFEGKNLYSYATSGSSGTPFRGVQDNGKRNKHTADLIYFHHKCGWELGEKYIFLRAWTDKYNSTQLQNIKNNVIPFNVLYLNEKMMFDIVAILRKNTVKMILGYGSALNQFADYLEKNDIYINGLKVVISDSDVLLKEKRIILAEHLNCKVVDRYSNEEHGLLAFSYDIDMPYEVNHSSYFVELLKINSNEYAGKGELGRVVITDLYNKAMPLIRYELGDLAISDDDTRCGVVTLRNLQGRLSDMLIQKSGIKISSTVINNYMEEMNGVEKYQLIQKNIGEFILYVVENEKGYSDQEYYNTLIPCIEEKSNLCVIRTNSIKSEKTGKFKTFVSLLK